MEVHAHTHTPRRKWTHYFWEFLMLFLAVFCGFLAEYHLEHKIEKEKGRQYVFSFYEDLKTDTAEFSKLIKSYEDKVSAFKHIDECYETLTRDIKSDACLEYLFNNSIGFSDLIFSDRTLQQLKNAGGLRLLKKADADIILVYDKMLREYVKSETTGFQEAQTSVRSIINNIKNHKIFTKPANVSSLPVLFDAKPELINSYFNAMESYVFSCIRNLERMNSLKNKAIVLINYFKEHYYLK